MAAITTTRPTTRSTTTTRPPSPYAVVLGTPYVPTLLVGTLIGRLPGVMAPTLVLLAQTRAGDTLAHAGFLSAIQALASALSQPVLARAADRLGHRLVLISSTAATAAVFVLLSTMPDELLTAILVTLSGLTAPALQACLRGRWPSLVPHHVLGCAHALDSSAAEVLYIAAPLLAAASVYGVGPASGYVLAAALGVAGAAILSIAPSVPGTRTAGDRHLLGPLRSRDLQWIMGIHACLGASVAAVTLAGLLVATSSGQPSTSGWVPALYAVGALVGGLAYGARHWPSTPARRLAVGFALMTVTWVPLALCSTPLVAAIAALAPGAAMTPTLITGTDLRHERVADGAAEASGWVIAATGVGRAIGLALATSQPTTWWPAIYAACALPVIALWLRPAENSEALSASPTTTKGAS